MLKKGMLHPGISSVSVVCQEFDHHTLPNLGLKSKIDCIIPYPFPILTTGKCVLGQLGKSDEDGTEKKVGSC